MFFAAACVGVLEIWRKRLGERKADEKLLYEVFEGSVNARSKTVYIGNIVKAYPVIGKRHFSSFSEINKRSSVPDFDDSRQ